MKKIIFFIIITSIGAFSQNFYVIGSDNNITNKCEYVNLTDCSKIQIPLCSTFGTSGDIAVDSSNNLFFINNGRFLFKQNENETSCIQLGEFPIISQNNVASINALVFSGNGKLYAVSKQSSGTSRLYEYSFANGIVELGLLPAQTISLGDLFFFENRLFLTCKNQNGTEVNLLEVNVENPIQSQILMPLIDVVPPFGAFSTYINGMSKSYLLSRSFIENEGKVYELNIPLQTTTLLSCGVNALLNGADSYYELSTPLKTNNFLKKDIQIVINNPAKNNIIFNSKFDFDLLESVIIYDIAGRLSKKFNLNIDIDLPISNLKNGLYLIEIKTKKGQIINQKLIINN